MTVLTVATDYVLWLFSWLLLSSRPSVLWHYRLGIRKSIWAVKIVEWWGVGVVICLQRGPSSENVCSLSLAQQLGTHYHKTFAKSQDNNIFKRHLKLYFFNLIFTCRPFSALTLLVGWQEEHPACKKTEWWGAGVVIYLEWGADLHMAQLIPLQLTVSCFSKIQIGFYLSGTGSPG